LRRQSRPSIKPSILIPTVKPIKMRSRVSRRSDPQYRVEITDCRRFRAPFGLSRSTVAVGHADSRALICSKCPCTILEGRASRRATAQSGSDGASPSRNHARPLGILALCEFRIKGLYVFTRHVRSCAAAVRSGPCGARSNDLYTTRSIMTAAFERYWDEPTF
jgi:hypothetical protein